MKSSMAAPPIYKSSLRLDPKAIMDHISKLIRYFLWNGGKGNHNRLHLVNWDIVKRSVLEGGLQIRDPSLTNLAMGGKFLWQLFYDCKHLVSQVLWKIYLLGGSLRNLHDVNIPKGYLTWNLC